MSDLDMTDILDKDRSIFLAAPLKAGAIRQAFPLAKLFNPDLDLASWSGYARSFTSRSAQLAGLQMLQDQRGYVHALFAYTIGQDLLRRRLLRITDLVIGLLPGMALVETLLETFSDLALKYGCDNVMVELSPSSPARAALQSAGFNQTAIECFLAHRIQKPNRP